MAASLEDVVLLLVRDGWLDSASLLSICAVYVEYGLLVDLVPTLMKVYFQSLQQPRFDYASQEVISKKRINQMPACAIHYSLDFGLVARFLGGE